MNADNAHFRSWTRHRAWYGLIPSYTNWQYYSKVFCDEASKHPCELYYRQLPFWLDCFSCSRWILFVLIKSRAHLASHTHTRSERMGDRHFSFCLCAADAADPLQQWVTIALLVKYLLRTLAAHPPPFRARNHPIKWWGKTRAQLVRTMLCYMAHTISPLGHYWWLAGGVQPMGHFGGQWRAYIVWWCRWWLFVCSVRLISDLVATQTMSSLIKYRIVRSPLTTTKVSTSQNGLILNEPNWTSVQISRTHHKQFSSPLTTPFSTVHRASCVIMHNFQCPTLFTLT